MTEMIGEAGISFYPAGGHNHDGITSSRIDSTKYSVWDWEWDIITSAPPSRLNRQFLNYISFTRSVIDIVNQGVLQPAGIILQPGALHGSSITAETIEATQIAANTITADEIEAGTITGDLFNANVVLVDQVIRSNNYSSGVSGWAIFGDGDAEFANTSIRGTLIAAALAIDEDNFWSANGFILGGTDGIYTDDGDIIIGSNVIIDGTVAVGNVQINANNYWYPGQFKVGVDANNYVQISSGEILISGNVFARAGAIGNWEIDGNELKAQSNSNNVIILDSTANGSIYAGTTVEGDPNWLLIQQGDVWADDLLGRSRVRAGQSGNSFYHTETRYPGVFYTHAAQNVYGRNNYGWAFTYDPGTGNVWAHMWDQSANGGLGDYVISKCLSNCGQTTSTTTLATTTTTTTPPPGSTTTTTTTTTQNPGGGGGGGGGGCVDNTNCPSGQVCLDGTCQGTTTTPPPATTTTTTTTCPACVPACDTANGFVCICGICAG